jgi:class 3 adenylate cyclase
MLGGQRELNERWISDARSPFALGIGLSTGPVAAALLGSEERLEYTLVGDTVNLSQRLQDLARPEDRIVLSDATYQALTSPPPNCEPIGEQLVKGRQTPVLAYLIDCSQPPCSEEN